MQIVTYDQVKEKVITIRNQLVILDSDVALLYGVTAKVVNQAVSRNVDKFPQGYILELDNNEKNELVTNCDRFNKLKHSTVAPKAFTEKGLYMLATILKSPVAIKTTIAIIDAFAELKALTNAIYNLSQAKTEAEQITILEENIDIVANLLDNELVVSQQETEIKIKLPFFELTRKITKVKNNK